MTKPAPSGVVHFEHVADLDVSAGSGLVRIADELVVVADDRLGLSRYTCRGEPLGELALFAGVLPDDPAARKKVKPDLEAIVALPGGVLVVPSGSKPHRCRGAWIERGATPWPRGRVHEVDLGPLYERIDDELHGLNVEGAALHGEHLLLFTRRTGRSGRNTAVRLRLLDVLAALGDATPRLGPEVCDGITEIDLGRLEGVPLGFTDAEADGDGVSFAAAAEDTDDPVADGRVVGCVIGRLDAKLRLVGSWRVAPNLKIEGIASDGDGGLWAVADADDPQVPAPLLHAARPFEAARRADSLLED